MVLSEYFNDFILSPLLAYQLYFFLTFFSGALEFATYLQVIHICFLFFFETEFYSVAQAGVRRCNHSSLQPWAPGLKQSSHLCLPSSWNYMYVLVGLPNFSFFLRDGVLLCCPGWHIHFQIALYHSTVSVSTLFIYLFIYLEMESCFVAQAGMQWCDLGLL